MTWPSLDVTNTATGVAHHRDSDGDWCTQSEVYLTNKYREEQHIRLDSRLPPTEAGSVLVSATLTDGRTVGPLILDTDGDWVPIDTTEWREWLPEEIVDFTLGKIVAAE